jgi:hypothetical protein
MCASFHAEVPSAGSVETNALPKLSIATQKLAVGQETAFNALAWATLVVVQVVAPPVGSVDTRMLPVLKSTATQKLGVGQDTPDKPPAASTLVTVQAAAPAVGAVDVTMLPPSPAATHRWVSGHEMAFRLFDPIRLLSRHVVPFVGLFDVMTRPVEVTLAQKLVLGHEMAVSPAPDPTSAIVHVAADPVGCVEISTSP